MLSCPGCKPTVWVSWLPFLDFRREIFRESNFVWIGVRVIGCINVYINIRIRVVRVCAVIYLVMPWVI